MALTIEELNIQIEAESTKATTAIDTLIGRLETLQSKLNVLGSAGKKADKGLQDTAKGATKAKDEIDKQSKSYDKASKSSQKFTDKLVGQISKFHTLYGAFKSAANVMAGWFKESNDYIETVNLFNVTMGEAAPAARKYAEAVESAMGIDSKDFMQYQGVFKNLTAGFGVATEDANKMSQNLTQLSYDMASFFNASSVEESFDKLSSAMSGQVKGLREYGIDTTVATLQEYALSQGIDKKVRSMTQAEKALLRYNYIMEQSQHIQGDMARTIITPANALRVLESQLTRMKRAFGNIVSVIVTQVIPYVQAFVEIVTDAAKKLAVFFGFSAEDFEADTSGIESSWGDAEDSVEDYSDSLKKAKKQMMGFDELNIISNPNSDSGSSSDNSDGGSVDIPVKEYDFLAGLKTEKLDEVKQKLIDILSFVGEIAVGLLAWKLSKSFLGSLGGLAAGIGLTLLIDSIRTTIKDGLDIGDIVKGAIGGALIGAAIGFKLGGWPGALGGAVIGIGVALSILGITSMFAEGVDIKNTFITSIGLGLVGAGIGFTLGGWAGAIGGAMLGVGITLLISGIKATVDEGANVENIASIIGGALFSVAGIVTVIKFFNKSTPGVTPEIQTATETIETTSTGTSTLSTKLKSLATNLAWGLLILAEVAAAAILIVAAIWLLGVMLEQVGKAWEPVIANGGTVAIAMGIGTGILVAIGVATALLGTLGGAMAGQLGIGIAVLALIGVAAVLFIAEILAIGVLLEQVGIAWQPVIDNGDTIKTAIATGTVLLVAVGVVTAALGLATVATAGALPLAIGLGTAILLELGAATILFVAEIKKVGKELKKLIPAWQPVLDNGATIEAGIKTGTTLLTNVGIATAALGAITIASAGTLPIAIGLGTALLVLLAEALKELVSSLVKVAKQLSEKLAPALTNLNTELPGLSTNMSNFTTYMKEFAGHVVSYTKSSAISGFSATVDSIIGFFTKDPIKSMASDANKQYKQAQGLNEKLRLANPELKTAISLMKKYYGFLEEIETLTGKSNNISLASGMFTSMKEVGKNLVTGFVAGMKSENTALSNGVKKVLGDALTDKIAKDYGKTFGKKLSTEISNALNIGKVFNTISISLDVSFSKWVSADKKKVYEALGLSGWPSLSWSAYAEGGFPTEGEMFIAREAGPELVGSIGRKTAVANNDQIVSGIESGVYRAVVAANSTNKGSSQTIRIINEIDGDVVGEKVIQYHNGKVIQTGVSPLLV